MTNGISNRVTSSHSYAGATRLLSSLFAGAPLDNYLEIRSITSQGWVSQRFHPLGQLQGEGFNKALPVFQDGKTNVYYGIAPRCRKGGAGTDVTVVGALWVDEWTTDRWPQALPLASIRVETSPGKWQFLWLLDSYTDELDRLEAINQKLKNLLGGDAVQNRDRIFRLPDFSNIKYPDNPRAKLVYLKADVRYSLEQMESAMEGMAVTTPTATARGRRTSLERFDPHYGTPLPDAAQAFLRDIFVNEWNLRLLPNGRCAGACPFPHLNNGSCECSQAFYASPVTGIWHCFCSDHPGAQGGAVVSGGFEAIQQQIDRPVPGLATGRRSRPRRPRPIFSVEV